MIPVARSLFLVCVAALLGTIHGTGAVPPPSSPGSQDLSADSWEQQTLRQLTRDEKLRMLHGTRDPDPERGFYTAGYVAGVPRLALGPWRFTDGPAGIRLNRASTALPAPLALGATFSQDSARLYGEVLGREAFAMNQDFVLAPMVNLVRVPTAGRNFEAFSEDPFLTARLAGAQVSGIQSFPVSAVVKHFILNNQETDRETVDVTASAQVIHETELPAFQAAVDAGAAGVMCAYNSVGGTHACENRTLLNDLLRGELGFRGFVISDWFATHSAVPALRAGLNLEMPGYAASDQHRAFFQDGLRTALDRGELSETELNDALRPFLRALHARQQARPALTRPAADLQLGARDARIIALQSAVLLKNDGVLPLPAGAQQSVALIGVPARTPLLGGGGSSAVHPDPGLISSAVDAFRARGYRVTYAPGTDVTGVTVPPEQFRDEQGRPGLQRTRGSEVSLDSAAIDLTGQSPLNDSLENQWQGTLLAPETGTYTLYLQADRGQINLTVGGKEVSVQRHPFASSFSSFPDQKSQEARLTLPLKAGQRVALRVKANGSGYPMQLRLAWTTPSAANRLVRGAVEAATAARFAVVFAYDLRTEGSDLTSLKLPDGQDALIDAVARVNPRTTVTLNTGGAVLMPWLKNVPAVLQQWYPGQAGGEAAAQLLTGEQSPSGRLPITFPADERNTPVSSAAQYPGIAGRQTYSEGLQVGYRWYLKSRVTPLFPFGAGLTYSTFRYHDLTLTPSNGGITVTFQLSNTGTRTATEVPQVYLRSTQVGSGSLERPALALAGFRRVSLQAGETSTVTLFIDSRALSSWSSTQRAWTTLPGTRTVQVGPSALNHTLSGTVTLPPR